MWGGRRRLGILLWLWVLAVVDWGFEVGGGVGEDCGVDFGDLR